MTSREQQYQHFARHETETRYYAKMKLDERYRADRVDSYVLQYRLDRTEVVSMEVK